MPPTKFKKMQGKKKVSDESDNQKAEKAVASQKAVLDPDGEALVKKLASRGPMPPKDQNREAKNFAIALGISFKGHSSHGANFSKEVDGVAVMQNVIDGMIKSPKKTHIISGIFQACGVQLEESTK